MKGDMVVTWKAQFAVDSDDEGAIAEISDMCQDVLGIVGYLKGCVGTDMNLVDVKTKQEIEWR